MSTIYKHQGQFGAMSAQDVVGAMSTLENSSRAGGVTYPANDIPAFAAIKDEMSRTWPKGLLDIVRARLKEEKSPPTAQTVFEIITTTLEKELAPRRARTRGSDSKTACAFQARLIRAECSLAMLFGRAPDTGDFYQPREYSPGLKIAVKPTTKLGKFVVDQADVAAADAHVLFFHNDDANRSWMLGWAKKSDMLAAPKGNRFTDQENCNWSSMAHYLASYSQLRPMSELLGLTDVRQIMPGMLVEGVPEEARVPVPPQHDLDSLLTPAPKDNGSDFYDIIGIKEETK